MRRTIVVNGALALSRARLESARANRHGEQVMPIAAVATRLAGGFTTAIDGESLSRAVTDALDGLQDLRDLQPVRGLPGLPAALAETLDKAWLAGLDLQREAAARPDRVRLQTLALLEAAVVSRLPPGMQRPADLVAAALARRRHAPAVLGAVEIRCLPDLAPVWRPLVQALAADGAVTWAAGARAVPPWVRTTAATIVTGPAEAPVVSAVGCATDRHEVVEAVRWARRLVAEGRARPEEIAIAAVTPGSFDDLMLVAASEANLDIHFAHGRRALATREGQATAALADALLRGPSQDRVRRLAALAHDPGTPFAALPEGWARDLPRDAPLETAARWHQALADAQSSTASIFLEVVDLLDGGVTAAAEAGDRLLRGTARLLWRRALSMAPATAIEGSLGALRLAETVDPATSIAWMSAATLVSCPRAYVRLIGLNSRLWPRLSAEDRLLPDHILDRAKLDPLPITEADRQSFRDIRATTGRQIVCSFSRRDAEGRLLGRSALLAGLDVHHLRRSRIPDHAMSEPDRVMARPDEFSRTARATSAASCWTDWQTRAVTAHDGLVRAGQPQIAAALARVHSASSLRLLLRNPLGFVWKYALGWKAPDPSGESLELDPLGFGGLVHEILDRALPAIEAAGGLGRARALPALVTEAGAAVAAAWEISMPVPPALLWRDTLDRAVAMATAALTRPLETLPGQRSHSEVVFNAADHDTDGGPWDAAEPVRIEGTGFTIGGRIDRLDLSADGTQARVVDYKTGTPRDPGTLTGGRELQRCLYAYAVRALLGPDTQIEAALLYPAAGGEYWPLADIDGTLARLTGALSLAADSLHAGKALPGVDLGDAYDEFAFALPADRGSPLAAKKADAKRLLGDAASIWEVE